MIKEVPSQDGHRVGPGRIFEKRPEALGDVLNSGPEVPHDVKQVVGVLVLPSGTEGQSLENDVRAGPADPHVPRGVLAHDRPTG